MGNRIAIRLRLSIGRLGLAVRLLRLAVRLLGLSVRLLGLAIGLLRLAIRLLRLAVRLLRLAIGLLRLAVRLLGLAVRLLRLAVRLLRNCLDYCFFEYILKFGELRSRNPSLEAFTPHVGVFFHAAGFQMLLGKRAGLLAFRYDKIHCCHNSLSCCLL